MVTLEPRVARQRAGNPSAMTLTGTNSYLIRTGAGAIVIDPGPHLPAHIDALVEAAERFDGGVAAIAVTHGHPDHAPGAALLAARCGAPVYAHRDARFARDRVLEDGQALEVGYAVLHAVQAPGHALDHLVFALDDVLFTGDVIIGSGTVVIAPPGGAMRPYQRTLERLARDFGDARAIYGGHGEAIGDPRAKIHEYIEHRRNREAQVLAALADGPATIPQLVARLYADHDPVIWPAAARQILAYLLALEHEDRVVPHHLDRAPADGERTILDPDLSKITDPETAAVARAELGIDVEPAVVEYRLA